jgi:hypothetical protein
MTLALLTEATRLLLERERPNLESRGTISLRGKAEPIAIHGCESVTLHGRSTRRKEPGWQH